MNPYLQDILHNITTRLAKLEEAQPEPLPKKSKGALSHEENEKHNQMIIDRFNALQEQEPVAWWHDRGGVVDLNVSGHGTPLYFSPPKKEWVGLTDDEIGMLTVFDGLHHVEVPLLADFAKAIEAKLKEKNT